MKVTIYGSANDPAPLAEQDLPWDRLCDTLEIECNRLSAAPPTADIEQQKRAMLAWSPVALRAPYRSEENAEHVSALVLDVDDGATPEEIAAQLRASGWAGFIYESPSATDAHPKFRVVSPVTEPIHPDESRATRFAFAEALGLGPGCGVERATEAVKLFFIGRAHGTRERRSWRIDGNPIFAGELRPPAKAWKLAAPAPAIAAHLAQLPPANAGIAAALGPWTEHAGRKWDLCGAVGGLMRRAGYTADECEAEIRAWLPKDDRSVNVDAGVTWARGAWAEKIENVSGQAKLAELVGDQHAAVVCSAVDRGSVLRPLVSGGAARAPGWTRSAGDKPDDSMLSRKANWLEKAPPIKYVCEGLRIAPSDGKITLIGGLPHAAKGPFADHMAACFALERPIAGRFDVERALGPILFLDFEGFGLTWLRTERMARGLGCDSRELHDRLDLIDVTGKAALSDRLYYELEAHPARVIFLDSYSSAMLPSGLDSNRPEFANLALMLGSLRRASIAVSHARKMPDEHEQPSLGDIMGSGVLGAMASTALSLWKPEKTDPYLVRVACVRAPQTPFTTFDVRFTDSANDGLAVATQDAKPNDPRQTRAVELGVKAGHVVAFLRACAPRPQAVNAIKENVGGGTALLGELLGAMTRAGIVHYAPSSGTRGLYTLIDAQGPDFDVVFDVAGTAERVTRTTGGAGVAGFRRPA